MRIGCALAVLALSGGTPAWARTASLRDSLGASVDDRFVGPMVGRFRSESGQAFVIDRMDGRNLLVRFDSSPEIWVLQPHAGPRGDVIYKNDVGEQVLRATRIGGLILFPPSHKGGVAAAFMGEAPGLGPPPISNPSALLRSFTQASARAGQAVQQVISFEARNVPLTAIPLFADAAQVAAEAFIQAARHREQPSRTVNWTKVEFAAGRPPSASAADGTLKIVLTPELGLAGRPSSHRIAEVIVKARPADRRR
jgi:hypothetical protein